MGYSRRRLPESEIGAGANTSPLMRVNTPGVDPDADGQGQYDGNRDQLRIPGMRNPYLKSRTNRPAKAKGHLYD